MLSQGYSPADRPGTGQLPALHRSTTCQAQDRVHQALCCPALQMQALSLQAAQDLFTWNAEAVERCATMSPEEQAAANVRQLFHSSTTARASGGCLLEQVGCGLPCHCNWSA